jgi:hypothetical protein
MVPYYNMEGHGEASKSRSKVDNLEVGAVPLQSIVLKKIVSLDKTDSQEELFGIRVNKEFGFSRASLRG